MLLLIFTQILNLHTTHRFECETIRKQIKTRKLSYVLVSSKMMLLLILVMVVNFTTIPTKANGCTPFIPSSLVTGKGKTGVIPDIQANSGGIVAS